MLKIKGVKSLAWLMLILGLTWSLIRLPNLLQEQPLTAAAPIATQTAAPTITGTAIALRATEDPKRMTGTPTPHSFPIGPTVDPANLFPTVMLSFTVRAISTGAPTATPWPSATPLPTVNPNKAAKFSVQNLIFGQAQNLNEKLALRPDITMGSKAWSSDSQWLLYTQPTSITKTDNRTNPDGLVYTSTWTQHEIIVSSVDGRKKQRLDVGDDPVWSPNGSLVAYRSPDDKLENSFIRVIDLATNKIISVTTMSQQEYSALAWLSENELLYYQNTVMVFDYTTGQSHPLINVKSERNKPIHQVYLPLITRHVPEEHPIANNAVILTPFNGNLETYTLFATQPKYGLIAVGGGVNIFVLQRQNNQIYLLKQIEGGLDSYILAFSPDGTLLAYAPWAEQYEIRIASLDGTSPTINIPVTRPSSLSWSPDSNSLAISWKYWEGGGIVMVNRDGSGLRDIDGLPHEIYDVTWQPQGTSLSFYAYEENDPHPINYTLPITSKEGK